MDAKRIVISGTVAATITICGALGCDKTNAAYWKSPAAVKAAASVAAVSAETQRKKDEFLEKLGKSSDEEVYEALYNGKSLADLASDSGKEIQPVIDLQVAQLTSQLDDRLASGTLTPQMYEAQLAELPEIVAKSVYGSV